MKAKGISKTGSILIRSENDISNVIHFKENVARVVQAGDESLFSRGSI